MPKDTTPGKPTTRRYNPEEKAAAVGMVRTLRAELGTEHGTVQRVAQQLGYGTESVRAWVRQADIDEGHVPGTSTSDAVKLKLLEQEIRELKRANEILKRAASFFGSMPSWEYLAGVRPFLCCPGLYGGWSSVVRLRPGVFESIGLWLDRSLPRVVDVLIFRVK